MTPDYQRGYRAGIKRGQREADQARFDLFMAAVMPALITNPWGKTVGGKFIQDKNPTDFAHTAANIARAMMSKSP